MIRNYQRGGGGGSADLTPIYNSLNAIQNEINSLITLTDLSTLTTVSMDTSALGAISSSVTELSAEMSNTNLLSSSITNLSTAFTLYTTLHYGGSRSFQSSVSSSFSSVSSSINALSNEKSPCITQPPK